MYKWSITYKPAIDKTGKLLFPQILSKQKLEDIRRSQGSYIFANQYLNITIPEEAQDFKKGWLKLYQSIPQKHYRFAFIDPAISLEDGADYTATTVVCVDELKNWYLIFANRQRITATQQIEWIFKLQQKFKLNIIGIESVAYQKALIHFLSEEMRKRKQLLPIHEIKRSVITHDGKKRSDNSKQARIRSLVPRFEFGHIFINQGLHDFELEYSSFPRGAHDDILDSLSSINEIVYYPQPEKEQKHEPNPGDPDYERFYIESLKKRKAKDRDSFDY